MEAVIEQAKQIVGYLIPIEVADWVRVQAARERRYPAHLIEDAIGMYRTKVESKADQA